MANIRQKVWSKLSKLYPAVLRKFYHMHLGEGVRISYKANLDKSINPRGIYIGDNTWVLAGAFILAHDYCRALKADTHVGSRCVIGINSVIMPGITIGDQVVVAAGTVVTKDIPSHSMVAGNPARLVRTGTIVSERGQIVDSGRKVENL